MSDFERFCQQAHPRLVAAFHHQFGDRWLAEELAQEALIRAGARWGRVSGLDSPIGWTFRVGCNLGVSVLRRRGAEQRALRRRAHDPPWTEDDTPDRLSLRSALDALPENQRRAVVARYYLGLTAAEAADALATTSGNVRVLTHRAILALRATIGTDDAVEAIDVS